MMSCAESLPRAGRLLYIVPFLSNTASVNIKVSALCDPGNVTWLAIDPKVMTLSGGVPDDAPSIVKVAASRLRCTMPRKDGVVLSKDEREHTDGKSTEDDKGGQVSSRTGAGI